MSSRPMICFSIVRSLSASWRLSAITILGGESRWSLSSAATMLTSIWSIASRIGLRLTGRGGDLMTDEEKAVAVQDGLAGVRRCPECGQPMQSLPSPRGFDMLLRPGWFCASHRPIVVVGVVGPDD